MQKLPLFLGALCFVSVVSATTPPAAVANGVALQRWEAERELSILVTRSSFHKRIPDDRMRELRLRALDTLILKELKHHWFLEQSMTVEEQRVEDAWQAVRDRFPDEETYKGALASMGISHQDFLAAFRRDTAAEAATQTILSRTRSPSSDEVEAFFAAHRDDYVRPESRHLVHAMIHVPASASQSDWEQAEQRLREIRQRLPARTGLAADAAKLTESLPPVYHDSVGDLGHVHQGALDSAIDREVFNAEVGAIVGPMRTLHGVHLVEVLGVRPGEPLRLEDLGDAVAARLLRERKAEELQRFEKMLRDGAAVEMSTWADER